MTFQQFLDKAYWRLNEHQVPIEEFSYGEAWILADLDSKAEYLKLRDNDQRPLNQVGIRAGKTLVFARPPK